MNEDWHDLFGYDTMIHPPIYTVTTYNTTQYEHKFCRCVTINDDVEHKKLAGLHLVIRNLP
jgi:5,10-methylenetetrahydrofolate reductase